MVLFITRGITFKNITSIAVTQTGTARACTVYGGTARLVNSTAANYTITGGTYGDNIRSCFYG